MITRIKIWNKWRKEFNFNTWYKIKVLFGLAKSGTFVMVKNEYEKETPNKDPDPVALTIFAIFGAIMAGVLVALSIIGFLSSILVDATCVEDSYIESPVAVAEVASVDKPIKPIPEPEETVEYIDVPLSEDVQDHIFENCEIYGVDPLLVIAIIEKESRYNELAIGDRGRSYGLMQIQPRWHYSRMVDLGCKDLLDPYQNISVGVSYISELLSRGNSLEWTLMAYNGGPSYANRKAAGGQVSDYVYRVLEIKEGLE
jgi:hypothetical protein